jgi:hypothetical protein
MTQIIMWRMEAVQNNLYKNDIATTYYFVVI